MATHWLCGKELNKTQEGEQLELYSAPDGVVDVFFPQKLALVPAIMKETKHLRVFFNILIHYCLCTDDFNRVVLKALAEEEHSDYINASYLDVRV